MKFTIYASDGTTIKGYGCPTFNSTYLKVPYLEFREISSTNAIAWAVGDQVTYNNVVYRLYDIPQVTRNGQSDRTQGGTFQGRIGNTFVYQNVQFYPYLHELELLPFMDIVKKDNKIHFSTQDNVSTFENLSGIKDRIQANIDEVYGSGWTVQIVNSALLSADDQAKIAEAREFSVSGGSILDALNKIYEVWENIGWLYDGSKTITIGAANIADKSSISTEKFKQGKGKGLVTLQESQANKDEFGTRLYAYGSSRNINFQYYKSDSTILNAESLDINNLMIPKTSWGQTEGKYDPAKCYIQNAGKVASNGLRPKIHYFDGSEDEEVYPTIEGMTIGDVRNALDAIGQTIYKPSATVYPDATARVDEFRAVTNPTDNGDATKGTSFVIEGETTETYTGGLPSLTRNVETAVTNVASETGAMTFIAGASKEYTVTADIKVVAMVGSADAIASGIITPSIKANIHQGAEVECKYTIDSNDRGLVHITCTKDLTAGQGLDFVLYLKASSNISQTINVSGSGIMTGGYDKNLDTTFSVSMRQVGFNIADRQALGSQGLATIFMNGGSCAGRSFVVKECLYDPANDAWNLTLIRAYDESIGMVFPNTTYPIATTDKFVLLDIAMPDSYIKVAETRLLAKANALYNKISTRQVCYTPAIDSMHNSSALASLKAGWYMKLQDNVLIGYDATIAGDDKDIVKLVQIDSVSITETDKLPSYRITLREEKSTSFKKGIASTSSSTPWITSSTSASSSSEGGTTDYTELDNKPSVNGVVLVGNKTASDLGLATSAELAAEATARESADTELLNGIATNTERVASLEEWAENPNAEQMQAGVVNVIEKINIEGYDIDKAKTEGWDAKYDKPANGIPSTDMTSAVQSSLGKADTAYQKPMGGIPSAHMTDSVQSSLQKADTAVQPSILDAYVTKATDQTISGKKSFTGNVVLDFDTTFMPNETTSLADKFNDKEETSNKITSWNTTPSNTKYPSEKLVKDSLDTKYAKPNGGIPKSDLVSGVQASLGKADTAYQKDANGIPKTDLASGVQTSLGKADTAYQKPSGGIPSGHMTDSVQTSLGKADTALQESALNPYRTATAQDAIDLGLSQAIGQVDDKLGNCTTANPAADKAFVNSSIATNTAIFKGTLDAYTDLGLIKPAAHSAIATALNTHTFTPAPTNNDYCFVINADNDSDVIYDRFKATANGSVITWAYEYSLNNSSFTATQWEAINSGVNDDKVFGYDAHLLDTQNPHGVSAEQIGLGQVENTKLSEWGGSTNITKVGTIANGTWNGTKIAKAYLADEVQTSLGKADTAVQPSALNDYVDKSNNQSIAGTKTFSTAIVVDFDTLYDGDGTTSINNKKEDKANKATSWGAAPSDNKYPSEKLVKDSLDTKASASALTSHTSNVSNPHNVTKEQVGLGQVPNSNKLGDFVDNLGSSPTHTHNQYVDKISAQEISGTKTFTEDAKLRIDFSKVKTYDGSTEGESLSEVFGTKANATDLTAHTSATNNPHSVTKAQVGLGNVPNTDFTATIQAMGVAIEGKASTSALAAHTGATNNPHGVTKAQVGLGNVPNTDFTATIQSMGIAIETKENSANKVTSWSSTVDNTHYPSEKLVKDSLDAKANSADVYSKSYIDSALSEKANNQDLGVEITERENSDKALMDAIADNSSRISSIEEWAKNPIAEDAQIDRLNILRDINLGGYEVTKAKAEEWDAKANDNEVVKLAGPQTITGNKTFTGSESFTGNVTLDFDTTYMPNGVTSLADRLNDKEETSNKVTSWGATTTNGHYPSEKLVKDSLDAKATVSALSAHTGATNNPHSVTKAQVGLGNVPNTDFTQTIANMGVAIESKEVSSNKVTSWSTTVTDAHYPSEKLVKTALDSKANSADLSSHTGNTSNPHGVTKAQVGLGNVPNTDFTATIQNMGVAITTEITDRENSDKVLLDAIAENSSRIASVESWQNNPNAQTMQVGMLNITEGVNIKGKDLETNLNNCVTKDGAQTITGAKTFTGNVNIQAQFTSQGILPQSNEGFDIGSSSVRWGNLYAAGAIIREGLIVGGENAVTSPNSANGIKHIVFGNPPANPDPYTLYLSTE